MGLTSAAIRRPIFVVMFVLALVVMGWQSRGKMAKELIPNIDIPYITVITTYPGAGPGELETLVTEPIEKAVTSIGNLKNVSSTSQTGVSTVMLEFEMGIDVEAAAADVRDKVAAVKAVLPKDADEPKVWKLDTSSRPIMTIGLEGNLSPKEMRILADDVVSDRLAKIGGVASINVSGGEEREISIAVNKNKLDAYGIGIGKLVDSLSNANRNIPAGSIKENTRDYSVRTVGEYTDVQDIANAPVSLSDSPDGTKNVIRVGDVASVEDTVAEPTKIVRLNGKNSVIFTVQKQSGANTVAIADGIKGELAELEQTLPAGVRAIIASDESTAVKSSLEAVNKSLFEGIILVVVIVFLFLHTARATFIVALAIPTSLMATFIPTGAFGFTQNTMVLLALSLVVGILVDDSIVVLENIERHLRRREGLVEAAINGRSEIGMAAITITMVDIVVFLPIAFMGGLVGQFFKQFGLTVAVATAFSLLMSFTLTPMLASKWMKTEMDKERDDEQIQSRRRHGNLVWKDRFNLFAGRLFGGLEAVMHRLDGSYRNVLEWALTNRFLTIAIGMISLLVVLSMVMPGALSLRPGPRLVIAIVALLVCALSMKINKGSRYVAGVFGISMAIIALTVYLPFGFEFFPQTDEAQFNVTIRTAPGTSLLTTDKVVRQVEDIIQKLPEMQTVEFRESHAEFYNPLSWFKGKMESQTGYVMSIAGSGSSGMSGFGDSGSQYANLNIKVVDKIHRKRSVKQIVGWVSQQTARIPGAEMIAVSASSGMGPGVGITKEVQGQKMDDILSEANNLAAIMRKTPGAVDVDISYKPSTPERRIIVDKYRAAKLGLSLSQIASAARTSIDGDYSVKYRDNGTEYPIRVHYALEDRNKVSDVDNLIIATRLGAPIYLSDVAEIVYDYAPNKIERKNRQRVVSVTANIASGFSMGNVNQAIDSTIKKTKHIPGTTVGSGGQTKMMAESFAAMGSALLLAILLVYMLMGALFESFLTPLVIMFSLPQAMIGALLALLITGYSMSINAMIGIIMLMGLVTKNAILLIDYTNTLMDRGRSRNQALLEAGPTRLRPILMTTFAMVGGMLPTAVALSQGSESRAPMAIAVIGGLLLSTLLTLIVIPVVFTIVDDLWTNLLRRFFPGAYLKKIDSTSISAIDQIQ